MTDATWPDIKDLVQSYQGKSWDSKKLDHLADIIRLVSAGFPVDEKEVSDAIYAFAPNDGDKHPYADAIELGNQIIAESPYPYQVGSVYLKDYNDEEGFRRGGFYSDNDQRNPITSTPDENCLKFRTPVEKSRGELQNVNGFVGVRLNQFKWNPWLYPHEPSKSTKETHNVLKTLEYGYKNLPKGKEGEVPDEFTDHSPHLVILYTGHE